MQSNPHQNTFYGGGVYFDVAGLKLEAKPFDKILKV